MNQRSRSRLQNDLRYPHERDNGDDVSDYWYQKETGGNSYVMFGARLRSNYAHSEEIHDTARDCGYISEEGIPQRSRPSPK